MRGTTPQPWSLMAEKASRTGEVQILPDKYKITKAVES
jgi:hypothetical protein